MGTEGATTDAGTVSWVRVCADTAIGVGSADLASVEGDGEDAETDGRRFGAVWEGGRVGEGAATACISTTLVNLDPIPLFGVVFTSLITLSN